MLPSSTPDPGDGPGLGGRPLGTRFPTNRRRDGRVVIGPCWTWDTATLRYRRHFKGSADIRGKTIRVAGGEETKTVPRDGGNPCPSPYWIFRPTLNAAWSMALSRTRRSKRPADRSDTTALEVEEYYPFLCPCVSMASGGGWARRRSVLRRLAEVVRGDGSSRTLEGGGEANLMARGLVIHSLLRRKQRDSGSLMEKDTRSAAAQRSLEIWISAKRDRETDRPR
jgi:hypothetical protein